MKEQLINKGITDTKNILRSLSQTAADYAYQLYTNKKYTGHSNLLSFKIWLKSVNKNISSIIFKEK